MEIIMCNKSVNVGLECVHLWLPLGKEKGTEVGEENKGDFKFVYNILFLLFINKPETKMTEC